MRYLLIILSFLGIVQAQELHVCTIANCLIDSTYYLMNSCGKYNILPTVLGYGESFTFKYRLEKMRDYLDGLPENDVCLVVDAFDIMIVKPKQEILADFLAIGSPFVIAAEKNCYPFPELKEKYPPANSPFAYINGGGYIGYVWAIKKTLNRVLELSISRPYHYKNDDDQGLFTRDYLENPSAYCIDSECKIFLCLCGVSKDEMLIDANKRVLCIPTHSYPSVLHANSSSFELLDQAYATLCPGAKESPWKFVIQVENDVKPKFLSWKKMLKQFLKGF